MSDRIVVRLERSALAECVLPHAIAAARLLDSQLVELHVLSVSDKPDRLRAVDPPEEHWRRAEAEGYLQAVRVRLQEAGVPCEHRVNDGDAAEHIVNFAHDRDTGLVIMIGPHSPYHTMC